MTDNSKLILAFVGGALTVLFSPIAMLSVGLHTGRHATPSIALDTQTLTTAGRN